LSSAFVVPWFTKKIDNFEENELVMPT
jgi:hypothetical protein